MDWFHTGPERGSRCPAVGPTASSIPFSSVQKSHTAMLYIAVFRLLLCGVLSPQAEGGFNSHPPCHQWGFQKSLNSRISFTCWFCWLFSHQKCPQRDSSGHFVPELSPLPHISQALMNPCQWRSVAMAGAQAQAGTTCTGLSLMYGMEGPEQGFQDLLQHRLGSHVIPARSVPALYLAFGRKADLKHFYTLQLLPDPMA